MGWSAPASVAPDGSSSPHPATVPPAYPAAPAAASSPATWSKLRLPTRGSGRPTSRFSSGSSLPAPTMLSDSSSPLSLSDDDLVDEHGVTGRDGVGDDLQPQPPGADHGVVDDDPPPLQASQGGRGLLGDLRAAAADHPEGDRLARGTGANPGRGDVPLARLDHADDL